MEDAASVLAGSLHLMVPEVPSQLWDPPCSGLGSCPTLSSMYLSWALGPTAPCLTGGDEGQERCQGILFMQTWMGMNGLVVSHVLNQKHDSRDSGSLCMGSFSSSWWCPLCRTVYLGRMERKLENLTGILQIHRRQHSHHSWLPFCCTLPRAWQGGARRGLVLHQEGSPNNSIWTVYIKGGNWSPGGKGYMEGERQRWDWYPDLFPHNKAWGSCVTHQNGPYVPLQAVSKYAKFPRDGSGFSNTQVLTGISKPLRAWKTM